MEHLRPTSFPESLKATLNCYQITSIDSLSGPSGFPALAAQMWFKENKQLPPIPPQPMVQIPYFIPSDKSAKRSETVLAGENIACFIVGGEKRLCLPQILTSVLREYSIAEINQACTELHIHCSRCLPEQLEILKALGILPINTAQCGLITKSDAERLVALLTDQHEPVKKDQLPKDIDPESGFPVYHECFGRGYGTFYPKAYVSPGAQCIMCVDCGHLYSPQRFIAHSDRSFEKRVCHWGFDPENWRNYLLLPKNLESAKQGEFDKILDQMKARFEKPRFDLTGGPAPVRCTGSPPTPSKRRYDSEQDSPSCKKIKEEDGKIYEPTFFPAPYASLPYGVPSVLRHSAFRPWSPGLSTMAGPNPSEAPAIQDVAHLKSLLPFTLDRRGFPQYIQTSRPLVLGTRASEFSVPPTSSSVSVDAVRLPLVTERQKSVERRNEEAAKTNLETSARDTGIPEKDKNNNHQDRSPALAKPERCRSRSFEHGPSDRQRNISKSPACNVAAVSPRTHGRQSLSHYPSTSQLPRPVAPQISNNNNIAEEPHEITRPVSRSREAAATAMLELKSAGLYRSAPAPPLSARPAPAPPNCSTAPSETPQKLPPTPSTPKAPPSVVPLDPMGQNYKWTIGGQSYIVSAAGVQTLEMLRCVLMNDCGSEAGKSRLMHEIVKMRSLFEEKLDIEMRVRRDMEMELEHLKTKKRSNSSSETRKLIRQEIETFRQEHARKTEDMIKREDSLRRREERCRLGMARSDEEISSAEDIKDLRSHIQKLENINNDLLLNLVEERGKREDAELRLEEIHHSRGRTPFIMESPLSRMVRGAGSVGRRKIEEEKPPSPRTATPPPNKKSSTQVPPFQVTPGVTSLSHGQLNGILPVTSANLSGIQREQHRPIDAEIPKTVVVT